MTKDEIKAAEDTLFADAILPPKSLAEQFTAHDARMDAEKNDLALHKMAASTRFWEWVDNSDSVREEETGLGRFTDRVEVNRVKPALTGHLSALFPRGMRAVVAARPSTKGKPKQAELALNDWLLDARTRERMMLAGRQGLMYGAAGAKVGYDRADGRPANQRVWWRVFPYWQLLLDADIHDWDDQRFIGHIHYRPLKKVEEAYGLMKLVGTARDDFLSSRSAPAKAPKRDATTSEEAPTDRTMYVRVAELCNLVDKIELNGRLVTGRLEVYVLDQAALTLPVFMGALPMSDETGKPMPHISELIFDYEAEYPLRPVPYVRQIMPQQVELNVSRSQVQQGSRRTARIFLVRKGVFTPEDLARIGSGEDGSMIEVDPQTYDGPLGNLVVPIVQPPTHSDIRETGTTAAADIDRELVQSPAALGLVTSATKYEVQAVEAHTESEFGRHAEQRDIWLRVIARLHLRALVDALRSTAGHDQPPKAAPTPAPEPTTTSPEEGTPGEEEEGATPEAPMESADAAAPEETEEPGADAALLAAAETSAPAPAPAEDGGAPVSETEDGGAAIVFLDENGEPVAVTAEDIDSEFDIGFTETGRTPMVDAEQRQNLIALKDPYLELLDKGLAGGPKGVIATTFARVIAMKFDFPKDLHPDNLLKEAREAAPPPAPPAPPGATNGAGDPAKGLAALAAMPPAQALAELEAVAGRDPTLGPLIAKAKALPPEAQAQAVRALLAAMAGPQSPPAAGPTTEEQA